jgi:hypothetical protein
VFPRIIKIDGEGYGGRESSSTTEYFEGSGAHLLVGEEPFWEALLSGETRRSLVRVWLRSRGYLRGTVG